MLDRGCVRHLFLAQHRFQPCSKRSRLAFGYLMARRETGGLYVDILLTPDPREKSKNENGRDNCHVTDGNYQSGRTVTVLGWLHKDCVAGRFVEYNLRQNFGVSLFRMFQRFQNQDARVFSGYEPIALGSKRLARQRCIGGLPRQLFRGWACSETRPCSCRLCTAAQIQLLPGKALLFPRTYCW